ALLEALQAMGISTTEDMVAAYSAINDALWKKLERGEIEKSALRVKRFVTFFEKYGICADANRMATAYTDLLSTKGHLMPDALEVCRALAAHCELYIITNGISSVQRGRFHPSPLRPFVKKLFISEELGFEKPRREYFDAVAAAIPNFAPERTLVIGDSLSSDIKGGIAAGLDTCWFNPDKKCAPEGLDITYTVARLKEILPLVLEA
ncbi:MAG: YjjG family noncanonical pyrimidine nucleotidase, partial [Clostridia bacterium]|nr:YjjG family noncanonical pyrimidine nucleotidase [Clostridia bacterium]